MSRIYYTIVLLWQPPRHYPSQPISTLSFSSCLLLPLSLSPRPFSSELSPSVRRLILGGPKLTESHPMNSSAAACACDIICGTLSRGYQLVSGMTSSRFQIPSRRGCEKSKHAGKQQRYYPRASRVRGGAERKGERERERR